MNHLEDNYVKKHIHDDVDWLVEQGEDPLLATKKARLVSSVTRLKPMAPG